MNNVVKEVSFLHKPKQSHFDLVSFQHLLQLTPKDHSQFEHHKVSFYVLLIITEGAGVHSINYQDYSFQRGTIFALRKNTIHKFQKTQAKGTLLVFTSDFAVRFADSEEKIRIFQLFNELLGSPKIQLNELVFAEIENLIHQVNNEFLNISDNFSSEIIRNLVQVLVLKLYRIKAKNQQNRLNDNYLLKFIQLQEIIENECFENKKVAFYASKLGVTPKTLNNITQRVIGKSTKSFIHEILIIEIKRLLVHKQFSITEIAFKSGFNEPTNFYKFFRKNTGLSPKEFRESINS